MLRVKNLRLKYPNGDRKIFDNLNLEIKNKEKVLLLGPSGSGKSTLLNVLSGIVPNLIELPMKYDELNIDHDSGVIFQDPDNQFCMPKVYEELAFVLENRNIPRSEMDQEIEDALKSVDLNVTHKTYVNNLSGGMKQKLAIVETILQKSKTLFLDEPTASMDTSTRQRFWEIIRDLKAQGVTIFYSSHYIEEVEHTADRILVLNKGELIRDTTPLAMRSEEIEKHFILPLAYKEVIEQSNLVENWSQKQDALQVVTREADAFWQLLVQAGCRIQEIEVNNRSLLDTIFEETQKGDD